MITFSFYNRKIINSILFCAIFILGAATLLMQNAAIRHEASARQAEERRDTLERSVLNREAAYLRFSLLSLRKNAFEMGFVRASNPRFVRRTDDEPSYAQAPQGEPSFVIRTNP